MFLLFAGLAILVEFSPNGVNDGAATKIEFRRLPERFMRVSSLRGALARCLRRLFFFPTIPGPATPTLLCAS
jgi:hypothetical protein